MLYFLPGNNFAHLKSSSFSNLTALSTLMISHNSLKTIEDRALSNLPSLKKLDLRFGDFYKTIERQHYIFSSQLLRYLPQQFVSNCPNLTDIDLSFNSLEDLHDGCFSGVADLSFLDLSHNQVRDPIIEQCRIYTFSFSWLLLVPSLKVW